MKTNQLVARKNKFPEVYEQVIPDLEDGSSPRGIFFAFGFLVDTLQIQLLRLWENRPLIRQPVYRLYGMQFPPVTERSPAKEYVPDRSRYNVKKADTYKRCLPLLIRRYDL